jgi:precorrin-2 dehydrogenase/sirohydrochlorin ferrochelatase
MGWTPLFLEMKYKNVLIAGSGEVGTRRAIRFLESGANVIILGKLLPIELLKLRASLKPMDEAQKWIQWADLVVVATGDTQLNQRLSNLAEGKLLNRADQPDEGDTIVPSSFFIGDVQICIFTQGKSPLMARELRKRIEKVITDEDILKIELQNFTRNLLKKEVNDQKKRKYYLNIVSKDEKIKKLLKEGKLENAQTYVDNLLKKSLNH